MWESENRNPSNINAMLCGLAELFNIDHFYSVFRKLDFTVSTGGMWQLMLFLCMSSLSKRRLTAL